MRKIILIVFILLISAVPSYAGYLMPTPFGFCVREHYCTFQTDVPLSAPVLPDNADYRFYTFASVTVYPRVFNEAEITYPEPDSICQRYVQIIYPCFDPRLFNQQTVPEYLVYKLNDPQWNWLQINCYADSLQRQQLADAITSKINYYNSLYNGVEKYPDIYSGRNKLLFYTLMMQRSGVTQEPPADACSIAGTPYRLFAFVYPSIKYSVAFTGIGNELKRGGAEVGKGGYGRGIISTEKGLGGYEVRY